MTYPHIELHTKEGEYFVKCYPSARPEKDYLDNDTIGKVTREYLVDEYKGKFKRWQQSLLIYPVHESQVEGFIELGAKRLPITNSLLFLLEVKDRGITLPASKAEIRRILDGTYDLYGEPNFKEFAFLVEEVKEETNEAMKDYTIHLTKGKVAFLKIPINTAVEDINLIKSAIKNI